MQTSAMRLHTPVLASANTTRPRAVSSPAAAAPIRRSPSHGIKLGCGPPRVSFIHPTTTTHINTTNVAVKARDPDALDAGSEDDASTANQSPPTLFWRVFAALCYLVPWIDSISLGREIYRRFRNLLVIYFVPGPLAKLYFSSQFAPLIIFFVMFLSIVKNKKLHHFVRFNCMQAIMLDIVVMLFHIVRAYLPAELKWSAIAKFVDMFGWTCCMGTVVYCVFWTLRGAYSDIPFVSESVYHQVALSEYA